MESVGEEPGRESAKGYECVAVLDQVAVGVYSVDASGVCTQINRAALELLGYSADECLGQDMHTLIHSKRSDGSAYPVAECPLYQARNTQCAVHDLEEVIWNKKQEPIYVCCSSVPTQDVATHEARAMHGTVITLIDVTSRTKAEMRLRETQHEQREILRQRDAAARVEHEHVVFQRQTTETLERTAAQQIRDQQQLVEDRLMQSEKLAAVGKLAASISHEINNPLEAVTNLLYLVRTDKSISEEACEYLRQAERELGRVTEIVGQTLRFQRGGSIVAECAPEALVDSVVALHQGRLHHSGIRINRQHRRSAPFRCAEGDIRQILNNLIGNAIDVMRESGGVITVRTSPAKHPRSGNHGLRISVSDSGHGMNQTTASKIFDPFYTTKGARGSGLGLWISSSIAKRHGGTLKVRSRMDDGYRGTTFSLFVPQTQAAA